MVPAGIPPWWVGDMVSREMDARSWKAMGSQRRLQGEDGWVGGRVAGCAEQTPSGGGAAGGNSTHVSPLIAAPAWATEG